jgi:drug/metabolite transporter, DME family
LRKFSAFFVCLKVYRQLFNAGRKDIFAVVCLGVFQIGLAYFLFTKGVANGVKSLDASIIGFIEPLLNPVWVFLLLGERPSFWAIIDGIIIMSAVIFHTFKNSKDTGIK